MSKVYLALYKGRKSGRTPKALAMRFADWVIRKATRGIYSHCEIALPDGWRWSPNDLAAIVSQSKM